MICIVSCKRYSQIITKSSVYQIRLFFCSLKLQLLATLQDLKDQLLIISPLLAAQVLNMLYTWCLIEVNPYVL